MCLLANYLYPKSDIVPDHDITKPAPASSYLRWASEKLNGWLPAFAFFVRPNMGVCVCVFVLLWLCVCAYIIVLALCEVRCLKCCTCLENRMPGLRGPPQIFRGCLAREAPLPIPLSTVFPPAQIYGTEQTHLSRLSEVSSTIKYFLH